MADTLRTIDRNLLTRRCVACGYDGSLLRGGQAARCARCGCDLTERPARSYAEMEGLLGMPVEEFDEEYEIDFPQERLIHRWLTFLFLVFLGFVGLFYLLAMALPH